MSNLKVGQSVDVYVHEVVVYIVHNAAIPIIKRKRSVRELCDLSTG